MTAADHFSRKLHWTEKYEEGKFYHKPKGIVRIKAALHLIFASRPLMEILRDYILGGAIVPLDIFEGIPISSEHIYRLLCFISHGRGTAVEKARERVSLEIFDERGHLLALSMLGALASSSIISRYKHFGISCPLTALATLNTKEGQKILVKRYGFREFDVEESFMRGMEVRYSRDILGIDGIDFASLLSYSIIFMDPKQVEEHIYQIEPLIRCREHEYRGRIDEKELTLAGPEMGETFHRSGLLAMNASSLMDAIMTRGDRDYNYFDPHYVKKGLWIPIRFMLRHHAEVVEEGEFSSTVEYMTDGKVGRYRVGMTDGRVVETTGGTYKEPLYEFPNGETLPYCVMLYMCATRFVSNVCDDESRNHVLKIVGKMHDRFLLISGYEPGKGDMQGYGDKIREFIIYDEDLAPVPAVPQDE